MIESSTWTASPEPERVTKEKIRKGNARRKHAKKGTVRRWISNCVMLASAVCLFTACSAYSCAQIFHTCFPGDSRPDVIEIFGGHAEVSLQFARKGWNVIQPCDEIYGSDLRDPAERKKLVDFVRNQRPRLLLIEWPCKLWGKLTDTNFRSPQEKRRLMKKRAQERIFLELTDELFQVQWSNGDDALAENPLASYAFKEAPIQRILRHPDVSVGVSHGCQFGLRSVQSGLLLKKPTLWISTSQEICEELSKRCPNRPGKKYHDHGECQGGCVTQHAAKYTPEMAQAIHKGYVRTLKRKDPGYLMKTLKRIWKLLGKDPEDGCPVDWDDRRIENTIKHYEKKFGGPFKPEKNTGKLVHDVFVGDADEDQADDGQVQALAMGIDFKIPEGRRLDSGSKAILKKLHCNLGHPSTQDLKRFMRSAGASQELVEAVGWMECASCARTQRPRSHRVAKIPPHDLQFNDQVMVDCFYLKDAKHVGHWFMSVLDRATMYHQVTLIPNHTPETFAKVFLDHWVKWAGRPIELSIDLETGLVVLTSRIPLVNREPISFLSLDKLIGNMVRSNGMGLSSRKCLVKFWFKKMFMVFNVLVGLLMKLLIVRMLLYVNTVFLLLNLCLERNPGCLVRSRPMVKFVPCILRLVKGVPSCSVG